MKRTLLRLVFCFTLVLFSCENDNSATEVQSSQTENVLSAKKWFKNYKANEEFHPAFKNIDYYWENAIVTQLENNSNVIAVPMKDNPENPDYKGKKMLYLYPIDHGYEAVIHEIFPKLEDVSYLENKKEDFKNLDIFSGYILTWDLKEGFVKGAEFENGVLVKNISFAQIFSDDEKIKGFNLTHKAPPTAPIELDPVAVTGGTGGGGCAGCGGVIRFTPTLGGGSIGGGTGGYIGSPNGGGSSISGGTNNNVYVYPDCASFNFIKIGGVPWQEAAVKNIRFNIEIIYSLTPLITKTETIVLPQAVSFQMPTNTAIGNTNITPGVAASIAAKALDIAMKETKEYCKTIPSTELMVTQFFKKALKETFELMTPGSRLQLNPVSTVSPTEYQSNWFFPSNCN